MLDHPANQNLVGSAAEPGTTRPSTTTGPTGESTTTGRGPADHNLALPVRSAGPVAADPEPAVTEDELVRRLRPVVLNTAGVAGLVPTMQTALRRLLHRPRPDRRTAPSRSHVTEGGDSHQCRGGGTEPDTSADGITVVLEGGGVTARFDITVRSPTPVLATALAVQSVAAGVLELTHPGRHTVKVNVLDLDPVPAVDTGPEHHPR